MGVKEKWESNEELKKECNGAEEMGLDLKASDSIDDDSLSSVYSGVYLGLRRLSSPFQILCESSLST
jgi:hypothetical protein